MEKMIKRWLTEGKINGETAMILLEDISKEKEKRLRLKLNIIIYTIAAIFIGLGVISFIAANMWILLAFAALRLIAMPVITVATLYGGYKLAFENKKYPKLGHALIFLSTLLVGGTYTMLGQAFNINAHNSSLMFLWLVSILPIAYIFKNFAVNILAIILYVSGMILFYIDMGDMSLGSAISLPIIIGTTLYTLGNIPFIISKYNKFSFSYKLFGLVPIFTVLLLLTCWVEKSYYQPSPFYIIPICFLIIVNAVNNFLAAQNKKNDNLLLNIEATFIVTILIGLFLMLLIKNIWSPLIMIASHILIITMIATGLKYGYKFEHKNTVILTNLFLIIYITTIYSRFGWTFMDKSLFFILGGIGLLALGIFLEKKRRTIIKKDN